MHKKIMELTSIFHIFSGTFTQLLAVLCGTLVSISDGMNYGWTSPVIPILLSEKSPIQTNMHQCEWLENLYQIGAILGLPITTYLVDIIGRKKCLLLGSLVSLICWFLIAIADRIEYLYISRVFSGLAGDLLFVAGPVYIAEIADQKIRGFLSSIMYLTMLLGVIIIYSVAPFVEFFVPSIVAGVLLVLQLILFPFIPESPYFLLYNNKVEEAKKSLKYFRPNDVDIEKELREINSAIKRQKSEKGRPQDIFLIPSNCKALTIVTVLNYAQHFSSISVIVMNLHLILESAGSIYLEKSFAAIIFSVIMLCATLFSSLLIDKFGRNILLTTSAILSGVCLLVIAVYFNLKHIGVDVINVSWIPIVAVMLFACVFRLGLGFVPMVLAAELFPANSKAIGITLSDLTGEIFSWLSIFLYQLLSQRFGIFVPFYVFSFSCFITSLYTIFCIPETKGKSLEEIQFMLKGVKQDNKDPVI